MFMFWAPRLKTTAQLLKTIYSFSSDLSCFWPSELVMLPVGLFYSSGRVVPNVTSIYKPFRMSKQWLFFLSELLHNIIQTKMSTKCLLRFFCNCFCIIGMRWCWLTTHRILKFCRVEWAVVSELWKVRAQIRPIFVFTSVSPWNNSCLSQRGK